MSTKDRYAIIVADAMHALSYLVDEGMYCFVTVGEVAKEAGVSKPTAQKHLDMWHELGYVSRLRLGKTRAYRKLVKVEE